MFPFLLEDRDVNITSQFVRIFKLFEDFKFISHLTEEMDKVKFMSNSQLY